jgi:hypothetical protein
MKKIKTIVAIIIYMGVLFSSTSCLVVEKRDNGHHRGWYKKTGPPNHSNGHKHGKGNRKH